MKWQTSCGMLLAVALGSVLDSAIAETITINPTADVFYDKRDFTHTESPSVTLYGEPGANYLDLASEDQPYAERILMKFDTSGLAGATIKSATLRLFSRKGPPGDALDVYRVTSDWADKDSNWVNRIHSTTTAWTHPGGDFANSLGEAQTLAKPFATRNYANVAKSGTDAAPRGVANDWNITTLVQGWASGTFPNFGLMIIKPLTEKNGQAFFVSSEFADFPNLKPQLIVEADIKPGPATAASAPSTQPANP